ncbi:ATP-dependent DNA helicase [Frigoribacterium faeni]|uniref:DNA 3'-5' helicase n=1 Tax=Frigoribacterium faeni TaxID=145483 RepID=A0A7W3JIG1_9MICO|nr:ATP-dependent DNA helicase [Frigoribacterium faeni]MBA8813457.1 DNA helicase-2/ATP-dependent DNA helicase PcrA [Frigoribacterium faeni]GEK82825.1 ATP-dependent DNA helicase [Frigoribacterium faeni]
MTGSTRASSAPPALSALEIAHVLELPPPTPEQQAVIEAPLAPALVVAGAGSGKTETMANRVVWLLANGHVRVSEVLGLTFTRKAAGELGERIERRIAQLDGAGLLGEPLDPFDVPTVSTYNAFANGIFRDNALRVGRESESQVLGDASAWQLARSLVVASRDERLAGFGRSVDSITEAVLRLSHALSENVAEAAPVAGLAESFLDLAGLPSTKGSAYRSVTDAVSAVSSLPPLLEIATAFADEKARRGFVEYSDQVALALEVCETAPEVIAELRARFRVVLLDEYQDTSVVQTRLLSRLFRGTGVMAVGDPHQSIYGFRGASAANLGRFPVDFEAATGTSYSLSTSWRNASSVLDAANAVVAELAAAADAGVGALRPRPAAPEGRVGVVYEQTLPAEAARVADWFARQLAVPTTVDGQPAQRTAALLFRSKKTMPVFVEALAERGVPHHVLGVGGLLQRPEVVDLVSCLRVLHDPAAGSELIRLMVGARWRVGVHDVAALRGVSSWLFGHDHAQQVLSDEATAGFRASVAPGEHGSIVDALDFVTTAPLGHRQLEAFSPEGLLRLRRLGAQLAFLRSRTGLDLVDLVTVVQQEMLLDVEVAAATGAVHGGAWLQAFDDELSGYVATDENASLGGFLSWLSAAERRDDMGPRSEAGERGTVQLLTIHGSKGLEWDVVGVPRLVEGELPGTSRAGAGWLGFGELPYEFRGDAAELPDLGWRGVDDQKDFDRRLAAFKDELVARHLAEERRLAYVAFTRAKDDLLLTGSFWSSTIKPRAASRYLRDLVDAGLVAAEDVPEAPADEENPLADVSRELPWPLDPLGPRRESVEQAASRVSRAIAVRRDPERTPSDDPSAPWAADIDLLLLERDAIRERAGSIALPQRIPASRFKDYVDDPAAVAAALRRPLPERPYRATRLGTLFHEWVEARYRPTGRTEVLDAFDAETDLDDERVGGATGLVDPDDARRLVELQATFERSEWAEREPVDVELEVHLPLGRRTVICKIDAVFARDGRFEVVDWKTGRSPVDEADLELKQLQLALYREAYAAYRGIDADSIDAAFYFVADDRVLRPTHVADRDELLSLWDRVETGVPAQP